MVCLLNFIINNFLSISFLSNILDDEDWLSNENPPWENKQDSFEDARGEFSDNEAEVFEVVRLILLMFVWMAQITIFRLGECPPQIFPD